MENGMTNAELNSFLETLAKLVEATAKNPQEAAEYILHAAKKERRDGRADDMTVVAGRFWKKRIP